MQYIYFICERRPDNNVSMQYFWFYLFSKICLFFSSHNDFFGVVKKLIWTPWQNWQKETKIINNHEINSLSSSRELIQKQKFFHSNNSKRNILQGKNLISFSTIKECCLSALFQEYFNGSKITFFKMLTLILLCWEFVGAQLRLNELCYMPGWYVVGIFCTAKIGVV